MKLLLFVFLIPIIAFGQFELQEVEQLLKKKQYSQAEKSMVEYVTNNPKDLKGVELLGDIYGQQKKWDKAIESYKALVDAKENNANYHYKYGGALGMKALEVNKFKALGMIGDVKSAFLRAAELDPKHIDTRWALVKLYMQLPGLVGGSKSKALTYADEMEKLSKVDGYLAKGYVYEYDKEPELAEKYYKKAVTTGGSVTCYKELTAFYIKQNQPQKALTYLKEGYKIHNHDEFLQQIKELEK